MILDATLYSKRELLLLRALDNMCRTSYDKVLKETEHHLTRRGSSPFRYILLLMAARSCFHLMRYDEAEQFLEQADALYPDGEIEQTLYYALRASLAVRRRSYAEAFQIIERQLAREDLPVDDRGDLLVELCVAHRGAGDINAALQIALEVRELWRKEGSDLLKLAKAEHNVGNLYGEVGRWAESLLHIEAALKLYREVGDINGQARAHNGIGVYFLLSCAYEVAIESFSMGERLYTSAGNELRALSVRGNIALCYHELGRYDEATQVMREVAGRYRALGDLHNYARATVNLSVILLDIDVPTAEATVLEPAIAPHLDVLMKGTQAFVLANAAFGRGDYAGSAELARQTLAVCEQTGYDQYRQRALDLIAEAFRKQGDSASAYEYQQRAYEYARDQHRRQLEAQRRALTLKLQRERLEHERILLQAEVEQKQKELTATTLKLVERSKLMGLVTQRLRDLRASVSDRNKPLVSETLALIESQSGNVWEAFEQSFDELTNRFFHVLSERHPDLSTTEQRVAGLLRAGMTTKEIATAMHISTRTVETHRYRLRKKVGLEGAADLVAYLQQLSSDGENEGEARAPAVAGPEVEEIAVV